MTALIRAARGLACALGVTALGGCFSVSVQTPGEPLPPADVKMRTETRQFAAQMSERVQRTADALAARSPELQAKTLEWKLGTSVSGRRAAYRTIPRLALVDTWTFAAQMEAFFRDGAGRELFGKDQAEVVNETAALATEARALAARHLNAAQMAKYEPLVAELVAKQPLTGLEFVRAPVSLAALGEGAAPNTVGSAPEVVADATERMDSYGQAIPDETRWRTQLLFLKSGIKAEDVAQLATRTDETLRRLADLAEAQPPKIAAFIEETRGDVQRGWTEVDKRWTETLLVLSAERAALAKNLEAAQSALDVSVQRERAAFYDAVRTERAALAKDLDAYTVHVVQETRAAVREFIFLAVAVLVLIFGTVFGVGFWMGRATRRSG